MSDLQYLEALRSYWKKHQVFPTMAKMCEVVGLASTSSVFAMVARLTEAGYLERDDRRIAPTKKFFARPIVSTVRAGLPQPASQDSVDLITIDDYLIDDPNRTVLCRVRGDSMKDAGLMDGDIVTVVKNSATRPGDIVVAIVDDEYTIKTLRLDRSDRYYLEPANPAYANIHPVGNLEIFGIVTGSFRRLRR